MPVIAGHIGVEVLPQTLDVVVVGAVGWKEVELDAAESPQCTAGLAALVDAVVIQDDMDALGIDVVLRQSFE